MAYLFVFFSLVFLETKGYLGKKTSICVTCPGDAFLFSLVRMLLCVVIGLIPVAFDHAWGFLALDGGMTAICLLAGVVNALYLASWILAVRKNAMVTVDVMLTVGSIIPAVLCRIFFGEVLRVPKMIGFGAVVLAAFILSGGKEKKEKRNPLVYILPVLAAVGEGMLSFSQQLYKQYYWSENALSGMEYPMSVYHFYTYVFSGVFLFLFFLVYEWGTSLKLRRAGVGEARTSYLAPLKRTIWYIVLMAVCTFAAAYCQTIATSNYGMPSQVMYPLIKACCLVIITVIARVFFGEKITRRSVFGILVALVGIVVINAF